MPATRFRPFRAVAYDQAMAGPLGHLTAPPYDVISEPERRDLLAASPYNAVRLELPELDYAEVRGLIDGWLSAGVLRQADAPVFIAWTQEFPGPGGGTVTRRTLLGVTGVEPYSARVVRPHERTHAGPKEDRLRLIRAVRANISPVYGLYPDATGAVWGAAAPSGEPDGIVVDPDGTVHRVWVLRDPDALAAVEREMASRWILIADGHHRYETAVAYRDERPDGGADHVLMGITALEDPGLVVLPTHRLLASWPTGADTGFARADVPDLAALERELATERGGTALGLITAEGLCILTRPLPADASPAERLDTAVLEREILVPAFGRDQAALAHDEILTYTKSAHEAADLVASGAIAAAILVRPIPKEQVAAVAESGGTMPQKSTYFFPKLLTGIAFNLLD